jgi:ankyrin repeat protein
MGRRKSRGKYNPAFHIWTLLAPWAPLKLVAEPLVRLVTRFLEGALAWMSPRPVERSLAGLLGACTSGNIFAVRDLLADRSLNLTPVTQVPPLLTTALHAAVGQPHVLSELLLHKDATIVDVANSTGVTPLMMACALNNKRTINMLLDAGANPTAVSHDNANALVYAVSGHADMAVDILCTYWPFSSQAQIQALDAPWLDPLTGNHMSAARLANDLGEFDMEENINTARLALNASWTNLQEAAREREVAATRLTSGA